MFWNENLLVWLFSSRKKGEINALYVLYVCMWLTHLSIAHVNSEVILMAIKGIVLPKNLSLFTHHNFFPNLYFDYHWK